MHNWASYSAWFMGKRCVTVKHNNKWCHFELSIRVAALDHAIWVMCPVTTRATVSADRKLPQMSNSRVVTLYWLWPGTGSQSYSLSLKVPKKQRFALRIAHIHATVFEKTYRMSMAQTTSFTSDYVFRSLNFNFPHGRRNSMSYYDKYSTDLVSFLAACISVICLADRYAPTKVVGGADQENIDLRKRYNKCWAQRFYQTLVLSHAKRRDFYYTDNEGKHRVVSARRAGTILQRATTIHKDNGLDPSTLVPMMLSLMTSFVYTNDHSTFDRFGIEMALTWYNKKLAPAEAMGPAIPLEALSATIIDHSLDLQEICVYDAFSENRCPIDAFIACMRELTLNEYSYPEVAYRVMKSRILRQMATRKQIVEAFRTEQPIPMSVLYVLA